MNILKEETTLKSKYNKLNILLSIENKELQNTNEELNEEKIAQKIKIEELELINKKYKKEN